MLHSRDWGMSSLAARAYMKGEKAKHELRRKMEGVCFQNKTAEERGEGGKGRGKLAWDLEVEGGRLSGRTSYQVRELNVAFTISHTCQHE